MANSKELFNDLVKKIHIDESPDEIHSILYLLFRRQFGFTQTDILANKEIKTVDYSFLDALVHRINQQEPIQYILGEADFYGRVFIVHPSVLIPRPETEWMVHEVIRLCRPPSQASGTILDIGTGSGCIAITLAKELPKTKLVATDTSESALQMARANATQHQVEVEFLLHNILKGRLPLDQVEIIVSNPPYLTTSDKSSMKANVLKFEPPLALFAPDDDPLLFYRAIATQAYPILTTTGTVAVEINERFGKEVATLFFQEGFRRVSVKRDLNNKDRVVFASR